MYPEHVLAKWTKIVKLFHQHDLVINQDYRILEVQFQFGFDSKKTRNNLTLNFFKNNEM